MASNSILSLKGNKQDFRLPMPPPLLHTRSGNEYERPSTPVNNGFTSPFATPQGSPSKNKLPPGAKELPNVFDKAMKLEPSSPTKAGRQQLSVGSPNKGGKLTLEDEGIPRSELMLPPGSPLRECNQENTPPSGRLGKDITLTPTYAALSRQEQYQSRDSSEASSRGRYSPTRGLTAEDVEKLALPKVKRLANVTQICMLLQPRPISLCTYLCG